MAWATIAAEDCTSTFWRAMRVDSRGYVRIHDATVGCLQVGLVWLQKLVGHTQPVLLSTVFGPQVRKLLDQHRQIVNAHFGYVGDEVVTV